VVNPGLYFKIPFIETMNKFSVRTQTVVYDLDNPLFAASADQQDADVAIVFNYSLDPVEVEDVYKQYGTLRSYEKDVVRPTVIDTVKAGAAKFTAEKLITNRDSYTEKALSLLNDRFATSSVQVERVNITNIKFSPEYTDSIERKVTAEQNALTEQNNLAAKEFIAQQRVVEATAEAEAIKIQAEAITQQGGKDYVQLKAVEKWNGNLPQQFVPGSAIPFINL
jgi:regulator of protease activity HflC (stomatin/prohibitin superfamily)